MAGVSWALLGCIEALLFAMKRHFRYHHSNGTNFIDDHHKDLQYEHFLYLT